MKFTRKLKERLGLQKTRMNSNLNGKMSLILGIFPASIGKKTYFFALGTIPETGVGFIGRKITDCLNASNAVTEMERGHEVQVC